MYLDFCAGNENLHCANCDSVASILFNLGSPGFDSTDTLMKNAPVSHICVSYLCFDSYHYCTAYYSEFSACVFFISIDTFLTFLRHCSVCLSVCLVLWASLPEIKTDDDDDDDDGDCIGALWGTTSHDVCVVGDEAQSAEVESRTAAAAQP